METIETIACKALRSFTQFVPGYGQVHGDPDNSEATDPLIPVTYIDHLIFEDKIEEPAGWTDRKAAEAAAEHAARYPQSGDDNDEPSPFGMEHKGGGKWLITGPGVDPETYVQGKRDATTTVELLTEEHKRKAAEAAAANEDPPSE